MTPKSEWHTKCSTLPRRTHRTIILGGGKGVSLRFEIGHVLFFEIWDLIFLFFEILRSGNSLRSEICIFLFFEIRDCAFVFFEIWDFNISFFEIWDQETLNDKKIIFILWDDEIFIFILWDHEFRPPYPPHIIIIVNKACFVSGCAGPAEHFMVQKHLLWWGTEAAMWREELDRPPPHAIIQHMQ